MISAWPKLTDWIRSHRADEQRRRRLEAAAAEWAEHGRTTRGLLDPIELADAEQWQLTESAVQLGQSEEIMALIAASRAALTRQRRRRRRLLGGAFAVLAGFAVVITFFGLAAQRDAALAQVRERERQLQLARLYMEQGRQLVVDERYQEAVPYLLEARRNGLDNPPLRRLFHTAERHLPLYPALECPASVQDAAFSPDGTRVVTASYDHTARVWDVATGQPLTRALEHQGQVYGAAFSPDGTRVVTASRDQTARVWDAATGPTGKPLTSPLAHQDEVMSAAFSPDGMRVVTASQDKTARVWDAVTGKPLTDPLVHQSEVRSAAFSPDGTRVVTRSDDHAARVWDAATGRPLTGPLKHPGWVRGATFSPDGMRVVTASDDHAMRVWDVMTGKTLTAPPSWTAERSVQPRRHGMWSPGSRTIPCVCGTLDSTWGRSPTGPASPSAVRLSSTIRACSCVAPTCAPTHAAPWPRTRGAAPSPRWRARATRPASSRRRQHQANQGSTTYPSRRNVNLLVA